MKKSETARKLKQNKWLVLSLCVVSIMLVLSVLKLSEVTNDKHELQNQSDEVKNLLTDESGVLGRSCGILSPRLASETLSISKLEQRFTNEPTHNEVTSGMHWADSCRYVDPNSSNSYLEFFIETYELEDEAKREYENTLPKVGTVSETISGNFERINYSAGAWFALKDKVIIKVSANNGGKGDIKEFSNAVFWQLVSEL